MKVLVSVKRVCDPDNANKVKIGADAASVTSEGLEWKPNPFDEYAVEAALRLTENAAKNERVGEVIVVSLGPAEVAQTLRQALAMGIATADGGKTWTVEREVDTGILTLEVTLPAVVTVDLRIIAAHAIRNGVTPADHKYNEGARYASLKGIMAAKKKPIAEQPLAGGAKAATNYIKFELPPARKAGVFVETVDDLVNKLKNEAKAI